jgi:PST family polysaccharide transporter
LEIIKQLKRYKSLIDNAFWLFFDRFVRLGIGMFVGIWMARYLGPSDYGELNYATAIVGLFSILATLGLDSIIIKKIIDHPLEQSLYVGTSFFIRIIGSFFTFIICVLWTLISDKNNTTILIITCLLAINPFLSCFDVIDYVFQSKLKSRNTVISKNAAFIICSAIRIIMLIEGCSLTVLVITYVIEAVLGAIGLILFYKFPQMLSWRFNLNVARVILKESWPLILSGVIVLLYMRVDQIMIDKMLGPKQVGLYSVSVKFTELWYFIPMILTSTLYPKLISLKNDKVKYYKLCLQLLKGLFVISFSISIVMTLFSTNLIHILYGNAYISAAFALKISIWTGVFVFWGVGVSNILIIEDLNVHNLKKSLHGVLINIGLNFILIPKFGINGAAMATLISQFYASYLYYLLNRSTRHIFLLQTKSILFFK